MSLRRTRSNSQFNNFPCSSFKDVQNLCSDDSNSDSSSSLKKSSSVFQRVYLANSFIRAFSSNNDSTKPSLPSSSSKSDFYSSFPAQSEPSISLPGAEKRIVVYFTSLRVVRSTFDDCNSVRTILRSLRVLIDERDVSMDSGFMEELQRILGHHRKTKLTLPRVFIGGRYIGGAEEIRRLNEIGELKKYVQGLAPAELGTCEACGGYRFILCDECSGSHKCYNEKGGFSRCMACNENGLIRCPSCSSAPF